MITETATTAILYADGTIDLCHAPADDDDEGAVLDTLRPRGSETTDMLLARAGLQRISGMRWVDTAEGKVSEYEVEPLDLVTSGEIARAAGVQPQTVQAWTERHASFPRPARTFGTTRVWVWADVAEWLARPRPSGRPRKS